MLLRSTLTSPYGRKVQIAAVHLGLAGRIEIVSANTLDPTDALRRDNPLGKMPVLVLDDGRKIYDSPVILECLDRLAGGGRILPIDWADRLDCLVQQALADGMLDAALLILYEGRRPEPFRHAPWLDHQREKILRGLSALDAAPPDPKRVTVGTITIACLLSYLDRRQPVDWRPSHPALVAWLDEFRATTPAFDATAA